MTEQEEMYFFSFPFWISEEFDVQDVIRHLPYSLGRAIRDIWNANLKPKYDLMNALANLQDFKKNPCEFPSYPLKILSIFVTNDKVWRIKLELMKAILRNEDYMFLFRKLWNMLVKDEPFPIHDEGLEPKEYGEDVSKFDGTPFKNTIDNNKKFDLKDHMNFVDKRSSIEKEVHLNEAPLKFTDEIKIDDLPKSVSVPGRITIHMSVEGNTENGIYRLNLENIETESVGSKENESYPHAFDETDKE